MVRPTEAHGRTQRVLLLSDTHGVVDARIAALAATVDRVVHAGDVGNALVLATLAAGGARVDAVRGNNDSPAKWPAPEQAALAALPLSLNLALPGGELVVVHGDAVPAAQRHRRLRALYPQARAIFYGHSHRLVVDTDAEPWVLNAGAAGKARTFGGPSCLLLDAAPQRWRVEERRYAALTAP